MDKLLNETIVLNFESRPEEDIPLMAFLFSRSGSLLQKTSVQEGVVTFKTSRLGPQLKKIYIAPAADKKIDSVSSFTELQQFKPFEVVLD